MYADDSKDWYPWMRGWAAAGGQMGNGAYVGNCVDDSFGVSTTPANRPLNKYVPNVNAWQCPSDNGDENYGAQNCFIQYGNSYCPEHVFDVWAVTHITADTDPSWDNVYGGTRIRGNGALTCSSGMGTSPFSRSRPIPPGSRGNGQTRFFYTGEGRGKC